MQHSFPKAHRLRHSHEFRTLARQGKEIHGQWLAIHWKKNSSFEAKLGLTVSRRFSSKAATRNRFKRYIREIFRQHPEIFSHLHLNVRPRSQATCEATYSQLKQDLMELCQKTFDH